MPTWLVFTLMFLFFGAMFLAMWRFFTVLWRQDLKTFEKMSRQTREFDEQFKPVLPEKVPPEPPSELIN
jgi:hypothetical protein